MTLAVTVEKALEMVENPDNEYEVKDLLHGLEMDATFDDGLHTPPVEKVYFILQDMGEEEVALNVIYPLYMSEQKALNAMQC